MTITLGPRALAVCIAVAGVLLGMAISQVAFAGAGATTRDSRSVSLYPVLRQLQQINATLGPDTAGSIEPLLREIEQNTYATCAAVQGHPLGRCER